MKTTFVSAFVVSALLVSAPQTALAQEAPPPAHDPSVVDHVFEGAFRIGAMLPGEMSPVNWFHSQVSTAPAFVLDTAWVAHPYFEVGAYGVIAPLSVERTSGSEVIGRGNGALVSGGVAAKGRYAFSEHVLARGGLTLARNYVGYSGKMETSRGGDDFSLSGGGWSVGAVADFVWRASSKLGASAQLGFLSQVGGSADVKGPPTSATGGGHRDFGFSPIVYLTVGPELFL